MSILAQFTLIGPSDKKTDLPQRWSGSVYAAILDYFEEVLDVDYTEFAPPGHDEPLDPEEGIAFCEELAQPLLEHLQQLKDDEQLELIARTIAEDWALPTDAVQGGLDFLLDCLGKVDATSWVLCAIA